MDNKMKKVTSATVIIIAFYIAISTFFTAADPHYLKSPALQAHEAEAEEEPLMLEGVSGLWQDTDESME